VAADNKGAVPAAPAAPALLKAIVAQGRTVMHGGRRHGPGEAVELSHEDHGHLLARGFIQDPRTALQPRGGVGGGIGAATNMVRKV
jgi:hypothetical protein